MKNASFTISFVLLTSLVWSQPLTAPLNDATEIKEEERVENYSNKEILIFTPHPDDETFAMGGTIARLVQNGNTVRIVIFTNDNKGSKDLSMTRERLARIRRSEEEKACEVLGIGKDHLYWLGYEDGDLEYADPRVLRGKVARLIKLFRPDVVFSPDPGSEWVQWHKTDHRMAAQITNDAFIASEWHLYYPQHFLDEGLEAFSVPEIFFYYSQNPNYEVVIENTFDQKIEACTSHVSQFEPSTSKYTPVMVREVYDQIASRFSILNRNDKGVLTERFRKAR